MTAAEWKRVRLDNLTEADSPITYGVVKPGDPGDVLFIRGGDLAGGRVLDNQLRTITSEVSKQYKRTLLRGGELLVCLVGQPGQVAVAPLALAGANIARQVGLIRLCSEVDIEFISYFLQSPDGQASLGTHTGGSVQQVINLGDLRTVKVPVPALSEQRRIVRILDEAFEDVSTAGANAEKNLRNSRSLFESLLQSTFTQRGVGWVEKPLGCLAGFRNGINYTKDSKGERIRIVGVRNFQTNYSAPLDDLDTVTIDGELGELDSLRQGDILAVRSNGNIELIGRCILVGKVPEKISHSGFTIRIRLSDGEVLPRYLCHFMKSCNTRKLLIDGGTGTNIKSLNQGMLSALAIPFPSIPVQKDLVEKLDNLSEETQRLESLYQRKLAALESLKKSLLHQAFTGQL